MVVFGHDQVGSITISAAPPRRWEPCLLTSAHPVGCRASRRLLVSETADLAVAQAVIDERENSSGDRHVGLGLAAAPGDGFELVAQRRSAVVTSDRLDGGPAHEARPLFGDLAPVHVGVGLSVLGRKTRPTSTGPWMTRSGSRRRSRRRRWRRTRARRRRWPGRPGSRRRRREGGGCRGPRSRSRGPRSRRGLGARRSG